MCLILLIFLPDCSALISFQIINYSTKMFNQSRMDEAKYLTLGVGAVNVTFTLVAVSAELFHGSPALLHDVLHLVM